MPHEPLEDTQVRVESVKNTPESPRDKWQAFTQESRPFFIINIVLLIILSGALIANQAVIGKTKQTLGISKSSVLSRISLRFAGGNVKLTGDLGEDALKLVFMPGVPAVYGQELNINFDQVQESMNVMKMFDPDYGQRKITLSGDQLQRYINVAGKISCEYCCGAASIISQDGKAACGCAHSQAMRGLAAYLIQNHGSEYSDDQILRELARWKGRYFPKQMTQKMTEQLQSGQYTPDIASLLIDLKLPKYSGSAGGSAPLPSDIKNMPGMVGGC